MTCQLSFASTLLCAAGQRVRQGGLTCAVLLHPLCLPALLSTGAWVSRCTTLLCGKHWTSCATHRAWPCHETRYGLQLGHTCMPVGVPSVLHVAGTERG
jgi:hypothetical protein